MESLGDDRQRRYQLGLRAMSSNRESLRRRKQLKKGMITRGNVPCLKVRRLYRTAATTRLAKSAAPASVK